MLQFLFVTACWFLFICFTHFGVKDSIRWKPNVYGNALGVGKKVARVLQVLAEVTTVTTFMTPESREGHRPRV